LAKRDLWVLGAESWFVVASYGFAKMIPPLKWTCPSMNYISIHFSQEIDIFNNKNYKKD
jgi:hypothetical protein